MLSRALSTGIVVLLIFYPVFAYVGLRYLGAVWSAALLMAVCIARFFLFRLRRESAAVAPQLWILCGGGIVLAAISLARSSPNAMLYYPVLTNAGMLLIFAHSLVYPPTVVERIARAMEGELPPEVVAYTRRVTIAWMVFFTCNGLAALYTVLFASLEIWTLYNGAIAYGLIGAMFGAELLVRTRFRRRLRA